MARQETVPRIIERLIDDIVDFVDAYIDDITKAMAPDGLGFGEKKRTPQEEIEAYRAIRGDPQAWSAWIGERAGMLATRAQAMLPPEKAQQVPVWDIAARLAIRYSSQMEKKLYRGQKTELARRMARMDATMMTEDSDVEQPVVE